MKQRTLLQLAIALAALILLVGIALAQVPPPPAAAPTAASGSNAASGKRGSLSGRVLGDDGEPVEGATVMVMAMNRDRAGSRTLATDADGNFKANNLPATTFVVTATVPGYVDAQGGMPQAVMQNSTQRYRLGENITLTMVKGGAITGKVLDAAGQPLVGAPVFAIRARDGDGRPVAETLMTNQLRTTDDRGVYRLWGMQAGSYLIYTTGAGELYSLMSGGREVPTYYPNATRDTAQEVMVTAGAETQGIDIRHRGDMGHAVSGTVVGMAEASSTGQSIVAIDLLQLSTGTRIATTSVNARTGNGFALYGVADGEYELVAQQRSFSSGQNEGSWMAVPRRVTVRGGDVPGIEMRLAPLGLIAGRVVLEKLEKTDCPITRRGELEELLLVPRREDKEVRRGSLNFVTQDATPNDKGEFAVRDLEPGRYRLTSQLPSDHWYIKALTLPAPARAAAAKPAALSFAASGLTLKSGEKLSGVTMALAEGAAAVNGRLEGKKPAARMRIFLVPAEKEAADDVLRYHEVVTRDTGFVFQHLAPGKYWLHARAVLDDESDETPAKPVAWNSTERAKLRQAAETANQTIELTTCQRVKDFALKLAK
ncbi:MAG TPA: carboxypeptidase regulatory-like domain-containing protein [Blastocatellia bacterium]|nr:carboxypeptidase regulatory-like domain-containing protein [Blastocatellia bacterium]